MLQDFHSHYFIYSPGHNLVITFELSLGDNFGMIQSNITFIAINEESLIFYIYEYVARCTSQSVRHTFTETTHAVSCYCCNAINKGLHITH